MTTRPGKAAKRKPAKKSLRDAFKEDVTENLGHEISSGSDRSVIVLSASILDAYLQEYMTAAIPGCSEDDGYIRPKDLFEISKPLGSFSAKITIARAFNLIPYVVWQDLVIINNVRNAFAHHPYPLKFDQADISGVCRQLKSVEDKLLRKCLPVELAREYEEEHGKPPSRPRDRWVEVCAILSFYLIDRMFAEDVTKVVRNKPNWTRAYCDL